MPASAEPRVGRTFGRVAEQYERARPEYPAAAIARAAEVLSLDATSTVLDLAAGTGKLTRRLAEQFEHVVAVEPDSEMRARIAAEDVREGTAERIPLEDRSVDAVFVGEAFHWFDAPRAVAEIERVLRPAGGLALLANDWFEREEPRLSGEARALLEEVWTRFHGDRRFTADEWIAQVEAVFGPLQEETFERDLAYTGDLLADLCITSSTPAALPDDERAGLRDRLRDHLDDAYVLHVSTRFRWGRM